MEAFSDRVLNVDTGCGNANLSGAHKDTVDGPARLRRIPKIKKSSKELGKLDSPIDSVVKVGILKHDRGALST